jgi:hypothetical protein
MHLILKYRCNGISVRANTDSIPLLKNNLIELRAESNATIQTMGIFIEKITDELT